MGSARSARCIRSICYCSFCVVTKVSSESIEEAVMLGVRHSCPSLLQVTRRWLNWHGDAVVEHLADQVGALEAALQT